MYTRRFFRGSFFFPPRREHAQGFPRGLFSEIILPRLLPLSIFSPGRRPLGEEKEETTRYSTFSKTLTPARVFSCTEYVHIGRVNIGTVFLCLGNRSDILTQAQSERHAGVIFRHMAGRPEMSRSLWGGCLSRCPPSCAAARSAHTLYISSRESVFWAFFSGACSISTGEYTPCVF